MTDGQDLMKVEYAGILLSRSELALLMAQTGIGGVTQDALTEDEINRAIEGLTHSGLMLRTHDGLQLEARLHAIFTQLARCRKARIMITGGVTHVLYICGTLAVVMVDKDDDAVLIIPLEDIRMAKALLLDALASSGGEPEEQFQAQNMYGAPDGEPLTGSKALIASAIDRDL